MQKISMQRMTERSFEEFIQTKQATNKAPSTTSYFIYVKDHILLGIKYYLVLYSKK